MTAVRTAEPPRLPVRTKTAAGERGWGGVSPMLTRLAAERATGVLVRERGTLHLAEGLVVHAESPSAPGLDTLLTAHGTLSPEAWQRALTEADDGHGAVRHLIESGHLTSGALELCRLTALYDAAYFALAPSSTPGRFRYGTAHPIGPIHPVPVAALEHETLRRRDLLHRIWPDPRTDEAPLIRADPVAAPALTRRQRSVLDRVNGERTAPDIARELGRPAFHTLVDVRRLMAAGVVSPRPGPAQPKPAQPSPARGEPPPPTGPEQLPPDPHTTLLKRLRDALEAL
ncbi:transcriptional regulator [Streptomyces sp. NPDC001351]|uniref:transcriptional regulator n=1 Tax=Streptomyces sp. NPDC001351 TaxID=3364564 RepID=UPI003688C9D1